MLQDYYIPKSIADTLALLKDNNGRARIIAGGTDLVLDHQAEKITADAFIDISNIDELKKIECSDGYISIGAAVTHNQVARSQLIQEHAIALAQAARAVGSLQIRNIATVVGNVVNAQPAADTAVALVALGAEAEINSFSEVEYVPVEDMYAGLGKSTVDSTSQLVTRIRFAVPERNQGTAFVRLCQRKALALPMLCVAAMVSLKDDKFEWVRLVMAPVGPKPIRAAKAEEMLKGSPVTDEVIEKAAQLALENANPRSSLVRGSREYRMGVLPVLIKRALVAAVAQAK
ncbi:MAG: FAD binding domain-containing protein [Thermacetogeniaceae bacterium]|jgi:carbon-monoxide dehydrogenase medium subunit|nr:FAD binding domain-containing protein [Thermoanaerobacterales bacterium]NLN22365.1 xanthine dehydrogenase family protein subunit M [Syntrophomonadaceae bacterium]